MGMSSSEGMKNYIGGVILYDETIKQKTSSGNTIPELIKSLGDGMKNLSDNAGKLGDISSASEATNEYVENLKGASSKVGELSNAYDQASSKVSEKAEVLGNAYTKAAASIEEISNISGSESNLGDQLEKVSGKLL